jgi:uncharacterized protein YhfF
MRRTEATELFWVDYRNATGWHGTNYDVIKFGDNPEMADELLALVLAGTKRATASLHRDYADGGLPLPKVGDHVIVLDGSDVPSCIYRSTDIRLGPLISVDASFAYDEGEGDRSREWWLDAHRQFFARQAEQEGFTMHDGIETVFERFEVVWPQDVR